MKRYIRGTKLWMTVAWVAHGAVAGAQTAGSADATTATPDAGQPSAIAPAAPGAPPSPGAVPSPPRGSAPAAPSTGAAATGAAAAATEGASPDPAGQAPTGSTPAPASPAPGAAEAGAPLPPSASAEPQPGAPGSVTPGSPSGVVPIPSAPGAPPVRLPERRASSSQGGAEVPAPGAQASREGARKDASDIDDLDLDSLLQQEVVSSTKMEGRSAEAPAVITAVSREEIQLRGYTSLAEVLRSIPGFYDVWDLSSHNVGVRGVSGGAGSSGSVLKLMIDGHPVDFRPTTGNFFGEELLPLEAIERVEVLRGPASALYGANAFLGVVNVITRSGASARGIRVTGQGGAVAGNGALGAGLMLGAGSDDGVDLLLAAQGHYFDRSGLRLPDSSPLIERGQVTPGGTSAGDLSRPRAFLGKAAVPLAGGTLRAWGILQQLDTHEQFAELGLLRRGNRVSLLNQNYRLAWERDFGGTQLRVGTHHLRAGPTARERFDVGRDDYLLVRDAGVEGYGVDAEVQLRPHEKVSVLLGADYVQERHRLQSFGQLLTADVLATDGTVLRRAGTLIPGEGSGAERTFENVGVTGQLLFTLSDSWSAIAGTRLDRHNIYGLNPTWRAGVVLAPPERPLSVKLLYGSSFKAPSAEQLYTMPRDLGDVLGNPELEPQRANTLEASFGHALGERGELSLNVFGTKVKGRVEFLQRGLYLQARNQVDEWIAGGELELRALLLSQLRGRLAVGVAKPLSRSEEEKPLSSIEAVESPLYPVLQTHALLEYVLPWAGLRLAGEASFIGERTTSQSNALLHGGAYAQPAYVFTALSLALPEQALWGTRLTRVSLRLRDLLDSAPAEPGFGGVDVPAPGRSLMLTIVQEL